MNIYIMRHGATNSNLLNKIQGSSNEILSISGINDIKEIGIQLSKYKLDLIVTSGSVRAVETYLVLNKHLCIPNYYQNSKLEEWNFGSLEGKDIKKELSNYFLECDNLNEKYSYKSLYNYVFNKDRTGTMVSWEILYNKILNGFNDVVNYATKNNYNNIIIISHGMTIGTILSSIKGKDNIINIKNGEIKHLLYENNKNIRFI